jgi:hypothetical protein
MENIRDKVGAKILEKGGIKYSWQCSNFAKLPPPVHKAGEWDSGFVSPAFASRLHLTNFNAVWF